MTENWVLVPVSQLLVVWPWKGYVLLFLHVKEKKITQERSTCWCLPHSKHPSPSTSLLPILKWLIGRVIWLLKIAEMALLRITYFFVCLSLDNRFACELNSHLPRRLEEGLKKPPGHQLAHKRASWEVQLQPARPAPFLSPWF